MNKTSTTEKLILYLYNETEMTDSVLVQHAIDYDPETEEEFENLKEVYFLLERNTLNPSKDCLGKIFDYSRKSRLLFS